MKQPQINIGALFGMLSFYLGYILLLTSLHLAAIKNTGAIGSVLNTIFMIFTNILFALLMFTGVFMLYYVFNWLVWTIQTPQWKKVQMKKARGR